MYVYTCMYIFIRNITKIALWKLELLERPIEHYIIYNIILMERHFLKSVEIAR